MSGASISKKLEISWRCPKREPHSCSTRQCPAKKKEYRRLMHLKRREIDNEKNRKRYHEKYKASEAWMKRRRESWKKYATRKGNAWIKERSKKYRKSYRNLSPSTRSKIRAAYIQWAKENWSKRVEYARAYRRKNPAFGFRNKIAEARRTGDIGKLAQECFDAIVRAYDKGSSR
jgi:hypothetical protein